MNPLIQRGLDKEAEPDIVTFRKVAIQGTLVWYGTVLLFIL